MCTILSHDPAIDDRPELGSLSASSPERMEDIFRNEAGGVPLTGEVIEEMIESFGRRFERDNKVDDDEEDGTGAVA